MCFQQTDDCVKLKSILPFYSIKFPENFDFTTFAVMNFVSSKTSVLFLKRYEKNELLKSLMLI